MTELGRATTLEGIVTILIARRKTLGLPQHVVDDLAGYADGYTGKLEAGMKGLGKLSLPGLLGALKTELAIVQTPMRASSTHRGETAHSEDFFSRRARKAAQARWDRTTPKERKKIARAAAKARWRKAKSVHPAKPDLPTDLPDVNVHIQT